MTPQDLKASILQLAIQGKLVPQLSEEGTGEELYQQIQAEKQRLIKTGTIKKEKPLPEIVEDEIPFDIPDRWKWVRIRDFCTDIFSGKSPTYVKSETQYRIVGQAANQQNGLDLSQVKYTNQGFWSAMDERFFLRTNDVLLNTLGNGTLGRSGIVADLPYALLTDGHLFVFRFDREIQAKYFYYYLQLRKTEIEKSANGSTNQTFLSLGRTVSWVVPLPPLAEQRRIVAKIEELLPLIDRYDQAWSRLEDFNKRFPVDMQKSILQMAIQGKLVPQLPEEGTGEELYQQIQAEKQALIKAGKIKKEKPLPKIAEDEIPFDIPDTWKWIKLGSVIDMLSGFAFKSTDFKKEGKYRLLRGINLSVGNTRWDDTVYVDEMPEKCASFQILKGDVLIGLDRPWISDGIRVAIYDDDGDTYLVQRVLRIRETAAITKEYIALLLRSNLFRDAVEGETTGISVPHISPGQVGSVVVPLPPLAEQKRIVAKLEAILPLCERLK